MTTPEDRPKKPVEKKVTASTVAAYLVSVALLTVLGTVQDNPLLVSGLPDLLEAILLSAIPALVTFVAGFAAKHTDRPDLAPVPPPVPPTVTRPQRIDPDPFDKPGRDPYGP